MSQRITITISEAGTAAARTFACKIMVMDDVVVERILTPVETQQVREMAAQYASLFQKGCAVRAAQDYLSILGDGLFGLFFERGWQDFGERVSSGGNLIIESTVPEVLQLPWEFLKISGEVAGFSEKFSVIRQPKADAVYPESPTLTASASGPLRVLFVASEPLDYAIEELGFLRAMEGREAILQIGDLGTPEELKTLAKAFRPHLVHLIGQGKISGGKALFGMQDENGRQDMRTAVELAAALKGSGVQCILLGGCQTENPVSLDLLAMSLAEHLPAAMAWNGAAASAAPFYRVLAQGKSISEALREACREIQASCLKEGNVCALPVLYAASDRQMILEIRDADKKATGSIDSGIVKDALDPLPGMTSGQADSFVNRRRDLQRLLSALREGAARTVIITGKDGMGKSALATRLAQRLALTGYSILPIYSSPNNPLSAARFLESFTSFLTRIGQPKEAQNLRDAKTPLADRLKEVLVILGEGKYLILWDGLELEEETGRIKDIELADFYLQMLKGLESSRAIITSRTLPSQAMTLPKRVWEWPLSGLSEAAFIKSLLQDEVVATRYRHGETGYERLLELYSLAAGVPGLLAACAQAAKVEARMQSSDDILENALSLLSQESRLALSRAAVFGIAVSSTGLATFAGVSESVVLDLIDEWQQLMLAYPVGRLWAVQPFLKPRLLAALKPEELLAAERSAGAFLKDLAEEGKANLLGLSRLDCMLEARGHFMAAGDASEARAVTSRISSFMERRGYYSEVIRQNLPLLDMERHPEPMNWIAQAFMNQGDYARASEWYGRALESGPDRVAIQGLGMLQLRQGKNELAQENFQKAIEICQAQGDTAGGAAALHGLASIDVVQKNFDAAMEKMQKILELLTEVGDLRGQASTLESMAMLDFNRGNHDAARPRLEKSLAILRQVDDRSGLGEVQYALASIDLEKGDYPLATEEFLQALHLKREIGDRQGEAAILHNLGLVESQRGNKESAWENFSGSLHIYQELCDKPGEAGAFFQLGALAVQMDKIQEGLRLMALAAVVLRSIKSDEVKNVEPMVERLAAKLSYSQEQFMVMVQEVLQSYLKDRGWGLVERAFVKK